MFGVGVFIAFQHGGRAGVLPLQQSYPTAQRAQQLIRDWSNPAHWQSSKIKTDARCVSLDSLKSPLHIDVTMGILSDSLLRNRRRIARHYHGCRRIENEMCGIIYIEQVHTGRLTSESALNMDLALP